MPAERRGLQRQGGAARGRGAIHHGQADAVSLAHIPCYLKGLNGFLGSGGRSKQNHKLGKGDPARNSSSHLAKVTATQRWTSLHFLIFEGHSLRVGDCTDTGKDAGENANQQGTSRAHAASFSLEAATGAHGRLPRELLLCWSAFAFRCDIHASLCPATAPPSKARKLSLSSQSDSACFSPR